MEKFKSKWGIVGVCIILVFGAVALICQKCKK